ncbi:MAG TPA: hypothetical protein VGZ29_16900 [Terriglobia bacterium]|nr:hypothetical protein [Terriglobia bacterium]
MTLRTVKRSLFAIIIGLALGAHAFAQYGGSGGGSTGSTGVYTAPKGGYGGNGAAIGAAVAAGIGAGIGIGYLVVRSHRTVIGCVEPSSEGVKLMNEKDQNTYALLAENVSLNPGERVALRGKKSKDDSGKRTFQVAKLVKDYGSCKQ